MATSPSHNLVAENNYLKAKLERNEGLAGIARDRALMIQELQAEIQELLQRSSVADLDSAVGRLRAVHKAELERSTARHKAEIDRLNAEHEVALEKLETGWKKVVQTLQVKSTCLETQGRPEDAAKTKESRHELHEVSDKLSGSGYRYVEVATYFRVKEELQAETKRREDAELRLQDAELKLKEAQEEIEELRERLVANKLVLRGPASYSPGMIREVVREAVDGMRSRSRGVRE